MNDIQKLPLVSFSYPDRNTHKMRNRLVAVTLMNETYITGYELQFTSDEEEPISTGVKFKKYRLDKISRNDVVLLEYNPKA